MFYKAPEQLLTQRKDGQEFYVRIQLSNQLKSQNGFAGEKSVH